MDYTEYKKLYLLCFTEDTMEDAELLFKNVFSKAKMLCEHDEKGNPIAMLYLMDASIIKNKKELPFYYLYAACTHPDHRGRGIMGKLLEKAKNTAIADDRYGIFLKPANKPLFNFYAKSDFIPFFNVCKINISAEKLCATYTPLLKGAEETSMANWYDSRKVFLNAYGCDYVSFSKEMLTTAANGSTPVEGEDFGFVYELRDDTLLIKEALFKNGYSTELLCAISQIAKANPCKSIEIRLPSVLSSDLESLDDILEPFSVMWLSPHNTESYKKTAYHGFAFD